MYSLLEEREKKTGGISVFFRGNGRRSRTLIIAGSMQEGVWEMESFLEAWNLISENLRSQITEVSYDTWFSKLKPVSLDFDEGVAIIQAPNEFHKSTLERGFHKYLNNAIQSVFGPEITFRLVTPNERPERKKTVQTEEYEYTFDTFIEGSSNKFAYAACRYVAKEPAKNYNPLFIYGNSGLGKTHLLNAIGRELKDNFPEMNVIYVKGDQFANELIEAIRIGSTAGFREKYRKADALLIDDIQFIAGKESTQEEFFHTFNTLYEAKKQIVLTSDRPPKDIATLEDRLKTRFEWGLTADIQPPDYETRVAIVRRKAEIIGLTLPDAVCEFIGMRLKSNIRQLEGTVKKLKAIQLVDGLTPTYSTAQRAISDIVTNDQPTPVTVDKIIEEVGRTYGVSPQDIRSAKRSANVSLARQISMYVVREITELSMVDIGQAFGGRDHSTVVYALQQVEEKMQRDSVLRATVSDIIKNIRDR